MAVERLLPEFEALVDPGAEIELLADGFGGTFPDGPIRGSAEGPIWWDEDHCLVFSDNANDKRYRWSDQDGVTLYRDKTNDANGLARDPQGRLIACEHTTRRVTREEP